jgi:hypothetical protein
VLWVEQEIKVSRRHKWYDDHPIRLTFGTEPDAHHIGMTPGQARRVAARLIDAANQHELAQVGKSTD